MKVILSISLIVSALALGVSLYAIATVNGRVDAAIDAREQQLIATLQPNLLLIYEDFGIELTEQLRHPASVEDMVKPLFHLKQSLSESHQDVATP